MPVFVGSSGDETELKSDRVGFAVSTANPSSASAGDSYFNSTDKQLKVYNGSDWDSVGAGGGISDGLIASGTLSDGSTVIINTDGTVSVVTGSSTPSGGTATVFATSDSVYISTVYDSTNNKVVIAYQDHGSSDYGTAVVGTVSGTSISFGTPVVFNSDATYFVDVVYDSTNGKIVIAYCDVVGNTSNGKAKVGTVSGTSITFGSQQTFISHNTNTGNYVRYTSAVYDPNADRVVIVYQNPANSSAGTAIVGSVSGTSITFGTPVEFESGTTQEPSLTYDSSNQKVVIAFRDNTDGGKGKVVVGEVSSNTIVFGSATTFLVPYTQYISATYDSSNQKVVIAYHNGDTGKGEAIVGTITGTSISYGSSVIFEQDSTVAISAVFDSNINKVAIAYYDGGNSSYGTVILGTVSGTSISFGTSAVFKSSNVNHISLTFDSTNNKIVAGYHDVGNSFYGTATVISPTSTNLTSTNFLGFSDGAYTNGQTTKIQIAGSVDDAQSSLTPGTQYYVQNDGSLSSSAGSPSVLAGTAISSTKIIVRK